VYLTKDTLFRPWCAGEIVTAVSSKVPLIVVRCHSFVELTQDQLNDLAGCVDLVGANILQYGITYDDLRACYLGLQAEDVKVVSVPVGSEVLNKFMGVTHEILGLRSRAAEVEVSFGHSSPSADTVFISAVTADDEAMASACILLFKIQEELFVTYAKRVRLTSDLTQVEEGEGALSLAFALIVLASRSTLISLPQLQAIVAALESGRTVVPVTLPGFSFPGQSFYSEALPSLWRDNTERAVAALQSYFKLIAVDFSTHSSDGVLETQAHSILERIRHFTMAGEHASPSQQGSPVTTRLSFKGFSLIDTVRKIRGGEAGEDWCN